MAEQSFVPNQFVYVTFIRTTPETLWAVLTDPERIPEYWFGVRAESDFTTGAPWKLIFEDGRVADTGEILEADPPRRLVIKWRNEFREELRAEGWSTCTMELVPDRGAVKLTVTHSVDMPGDEPSKFVQAVSGGWPSILSNLKSLLETGAVALEQRPAA